MVYNGFTRIPDEGSTIGDHIVSALASTGVQDKKSCG